MIYAHVSVCLVRFAILLPLAATGCASSSADHDQDSGCCPGGPDSNGTADGTSDAPIDVTCTDDGAGTARNGFPADFPELVDTGGSGAGEKIIGFGGDTTRGCAGNRAARKRRPIVLLHGNGVNATNPSFGMTHIAAMLRQAGYVDAEIWAPSYLGQNISSAEIPTPQRNNIDDVRRFADAVRAYLGVDRIDLVGHSLGCGQINGYLRGLQKNGSFNPAQHRFDAVGTVVCLGGALYGTGEGFLYDPEFNASGGFVAAGLAWTGVEDATPYGATAVAQMTVPSAGTLPGNRPYARVTSADDGSRRIHYVGIWSNGDIVDSGMPRTGGLQGADLVRGFDLPSTLPGALSAQLARHGHLVQNQPVFDAFVPYLDK
jgi:pimeloyl-ACP methyl ester carboxylesterase